MARESDEGYDRVSMVIRYLVEDHAQFAFLDRIRAVISRDKVAELSGVPVDQVTVGLFQAALGSHSVEWELRISLPRLERLGRFMDGASRRGEDGQTPLLERLTSIDGADVRDRGVPIYRGWTL